MEYTFKSLFKIGDVVEFKGSTYLKDGLYRIDSVSGFTSTGEFQLENIQYFLENLTEYGKDWDMDDERFTEGLKDGTIKLSETKVDTYLVTYKNLEKDEIDQEVIHVIADTQVDDSYFKEHIVPGFHINEYGVFVKDEAAIESFELIKEF